jgi:soluble lytic murein transglycosylase-like protein
MSIICQQGVMKVESPAAVTDQGRTHSTPQSHRSVEGERRIGQSVLQFARMIARTPIVALLTMLVLTSCVRDDAPPPPTIEDPTGAGAEAISPPPTIPAATVVDPCPAAKTAASVPGAAERIASAWCLVRNNQGQRALDLLEAGHSPDQLLNDYARLVLGEAALLIDDAPRAATELEGLKFPEGPARRRLQNLRGQALIRSGRTAEGRLQLKAFLKGGWAAAGKRPEPSGGDPVEARWWLAEAARAEGDSASETRLLKQLWALLPGSAREEEVLLRLSEGGAAFPDLSHAAGVALMRERIGTLESTYHWKEALALRDQLPAPQGPRQRAAFARVVLKARDYPRALTLYEALKNPGPGEVFNHAVVATRTGNYERATELYRQIYEADVDSATRPRKKAVDQASYKIGYLAYDSGQFDLAIVELKAHLQRYPRSRYAESSRWFIAWSLIKLKRLDTALGALGRLKQAHPKSSMNAAVDYWVARIAGMQGDPERQRKGLARVLANYPVSSYAWFAAGQLGRRWEPRPPPAPSLLPAVEDLAPVQRGRALANAGLDAWARGELRSLKALLGQGKPTVVQAYAEALAATGAWAEARKLVLSRCRSAISANKDPALARLCWPRPLGDVAAQAAREGGVSPHLPFAIMRAETGWKPWLTSPAGASGLMQVMPSLGESLTKELHPGRHWDPLDLYDPATNAELGVAELVSLHKRFDGTGVTPRTPLVIAGYNGGETAVRRWLGLYESPPPADVFAEDVGYTETRRYVRKVLATLMAYRYVYGDEPTSAP